MSECYLVWRPFSSEEIARRSRKRTKFKGKITKKALERPRGNGRNALGNKRIASKWQRRFLEKTRGNKCAKCDETEGLTVDHIIPWSQGGKTKVENLQLLCEPCHKEKTKKDNIKYNI